MQQLWFIDKPITTCFGHHCAHLQESNAVHYCVWFTALEVLDGVLGRREEGRVHCVEAGFWTVEKQPLHSTHDLPPGVPRLQPALQVLKTICSSVQHCTAEDGHNGPRNMLSYRFINHNCCIKLV